MIPQHIFRLCIPPDSRTAYAQSRTTYHWIRLHKLDASHPSGPSSAYVPWLAVRFSRQVYDMHISTSEWMRGQAARSLTRHTRGCSEYIFVLLDGELFIYLGFLPVTSCNASANSKPLRSLVWSSCWQNPGPTTARQVSGQQEVRFFALIIRAKSRTPVPIASKWSVVCSCFRASFFTHKNNNNDGNQNRTRLLRSGFF